MANDDKQPGPRQQPPSQIPAATQQTRQHERPPPDSPPKREGVTSSVDNTISSVPSPNKQRVSSQEAAFKGSSQAALVITLDDDSCEAHGDTSEIRKNNGNSIVKSSEKASSSSSIASKHVISIPQPVHPLTTTVTSKAPIILPFVRKKTIPKKNDRLKNAPAPPTTDKQSADSSVPVPERNNNLESPKSTTESVQGTDPKPIEKPQAQPSYSTNKSAPPTSNGSENSSNIISDPQPSKLAQSVKFKGVEPPSSGSKDPVILSLKPTQGKPPTTLTPQAKTPESKGTFKQSMAKQYNSSPFSWDVYLNILPAEIAPKNAFRQTFPLPENKFLPGMKLEAKDPRNSSSWCLASVMSTEGLRLCLRFDGGDAMNDIYELIDSGNIRPIGSKPMEPLLPPMSYQGNLANYPKFVEKVLSDSKTNIAPPDYFIPQPAKPKNNLFRVGMKLEAVDKKRREFTCPATIGEVNGDEVKIIFDGWRGSFDYTCKYHSRDLFPVNWCRDTKSYIQQPNGWDSLLSKDPAEQAQLAAKMVNVGSSSRLSPDQTPSHKNTSQQARERASQPHGSASTSKKPVTSGRGRPSTKHSKTLPSKLKQPTHANTKKRDAQPDEKCPKSQEADEKVLSPESVDDDDMEMDSLSPAERYQCQRTVPYNEWQKKKLGDQMPRDKDEMIDRAKSKEENSNPANDSFSSTSTTSYQLDTKDLDKSNKPHSNGRAREDTGPPQSAKKVRFETPSPSSTLAKQRELIRSKPSSLTLWTVRDVLDLIATDETLAKYSNIFTDHEIDGKAFVLLTTDMMINHMGLKIGPVLKINDLIEQVKRFK